MKKIDIGHGNQLSKKRGATILREVPESRPHRIYNKPRLIDLGSILELTRGIGNDISDGDFTGSGAT
jgi:hypothetical protein